MLGADTEEEDCDTGNEAEADEEVGTSTATKE